MCIRDRKGFAVLPYINADPILAKRLEEIGCVTVMPLGSPIGSGQGLLNLSNIRIIIENAKVPVIIDAGIGVPSEASQAMEIGADGVLINSAIAQAANPPLMAQAINYSVKAGRQAFLAGRIKNNQTGENLLEKINWGKYWMLPNTAGCVNSDEAVRIAILGRELAKLSGQEENNFVKLEVIPDKKYLLPDPIETLKACLLYTSPSPRDS